MVFYCSGLFGFVERSDFQQMKKKRWKKGTKKSSELPSQPPFKTKP